MAQSQRNATRRSGGHPGMTGMFVGLLLGLCLALGVALYLTRANPFVARTKPTPAEVKREPRPESSKPIVGLPTGKPAPDKANADSARFNFYEILEGKDEAKPAKEAKPESSAAAGPGLRKVYYLQAGAFQKPADADNLKARLALAGLEAQIQTANIPDKGIWHRVRLGPFDAEAAKQAQAVLLENKIQSSILEVTEQQQPKG